MAREKATVRSPDGEASVSAAVVDLPAGRYLLAVSGGRDSMVLLDAFVRHRRDAVAVATFDHGTGPAATKAARLVELEAQRRETPVVAGHVGAPLAPSEAVWRAARWEFLDGWATELNATVVTAHTRDDQIETVVMRVLRDTLHTSPRGLAAMLAPSRVGRPLLSVGRADIAGYAASRRVSYIDDPSNDDAGFLRNRVRHELLPALERARPGFRDEMFALSRRAADWRADVEGVVDTLGVQVLPPLVVPVHALFSFSPEALGVLWPAIAGRIGVVLDWRGTERVVDFTGSAKPGQRMPVSGGASVERTASTFVVRPSTARDSLYS